MGIFKRYAHNFVKLIFISLLGSSIKLNFVIFTFFPVWPRFHMKLSGPNEFYLLGRFFKVGVGWAHLNLFFHFWQEMIEKIIVVGRRTLIVSHLAVQTLVWYAIHHIRTLLSEVIKPFCMSCLSVKLPLIDLL